MSVIDWQRLIQEIGVTGAVTCQPVSGGSINQCYRLQTATWTGFVKLNERDRLGMFIAEAEALHQLALTQTLRVPAVLGHGTLDDHSFLVLEWLPLANRLANWQALGEQLARLHQTPAGLDFGWDRENTIGSTPQINTWHRDWVTFFQEQRLGYQLQLAQAQGFVPTGSERLLDRLPQFFRSYTPIPALVHGDLWRGNVGFLTTGEPVIFDPALYVGDREVDLALTELFGGFAPEFYRAYHATYPLDPGYQERKILYNLYHVLNHFNLFGSGYRIQAEQMIRQLLN
ncbi:fructosamine kinase family protein [Candidatus Cyanaurora vandensis]|uniref:fructosamine kinase family protein n=1 Tax=Candidatus Cyanaurora vandensis TaxID=2714958 RepID=UPI00257A0104|nr:fructosamine kinase family protein [Candidatus Cyanaurora vandensis]